MSARRYFVPWYRRGFGSVVDGQPSGGRASLPVTIALDGATSLALPVQLAGPGDVVGLDPAEIRRCEPYDGCPDVEPGYFPYVELASADLPWRFSPYPPETVTLVDPEHGGTSTGSRLQPWLALVVVPADQATLLPAQSGSLPVLQTTGDQLPPPGESWAWAHVQVSLTDPPTDPGGAITDALADPGRSVARLICPRRLDAATRYSACLVPAFAAGRSVLGEDVGPDPLAPAWPASGAVALPVYFSWTFATSQAGTFELLARRLRPRAAPGGSSGRTLDTSDPGWGADVQTGRTTLMQGALRPLGADEPAPDSALAGSLRGAVSSAAGAIELLPPIYGSDYQDGIGSLDGVPDGWLVQLNTDPRRRLAAGLASWAVAVQQEELADLAWQQLAAAGVATTPVRATTDLATLVTTTLGTLHPPAASAAPALLRLTRGRGPLPGALLDRPVPRPRPVVAPPSTFAPTFTRPAYELLRAVSPEWLLPGAESIPLDSVVLLRSNPDFVEAYLVGLNHALAQELLWRSYPLDRDATMFAHFWGVAGGADAMDIAGWAPASALGDHLGGADQLVLLIRGSFMARFPTVDITLSRVRGDGVEEVVQPNMVGRVSFDATFVGFPLTPTRARTPPSDGGGEWRIVLQEDVQHARFGVDDPSANTTLASWQDLDWANPQLSGRHLGVANLAGITRPVSAGSADTATWGLSSGHFASALQQPAFRLRIPLQLWLPEEAE